MSWYKYETHMHSSGGSACGHATTAELVRAYHAAGYAGAVLTDHFGQGNTCVPRDIPWKAQIDMFEASYLSGKEVADALDFDLFFGIEHGYYQSSREILLYGITPDFLRANPDIPEISIDEFARRVHAVGGFITHAHPCRRRWYTKDDVPINLAICDAVEVNNFTDPEEFNAEHRALAEKAGLPMLSGADTHSADAAGIGQAGIAFPRRMRTMDDFVCALRAGEGRLIIDGVIQA